MIFKISFLDLNSSKYTKKPFKRQYYKKNPIKNNLDDDFWEFNFHTAISKRGTCSIVSNKKWFSLDELNQNASVKGLDN